MIKISVYVKEGNEYTYDDLHDATEAEAAIHAVKLLHPTWVSIHLELTRQEKEKFRV